MYKFYPTSPRGFFNAAVQSASLIARKDLAAERSLLLTKWFSYRFISPIEATMQFAKAYRSALIHHVQINRGIGPDGQVYRPRSFSVPSTCSGEFTRMWRARQRADALCVPYELYLEFCFEFAGRRRRHYAPQPNQIGPNAANCEAWFNKFKEFLEGRASMALSQLVDMPQFDVRHYRGLPAQEDLLEYLEAEVKMSGRSWSDLIGMWSLQRGLFPLLRYRNLVDRGALQLAFPRARSAVYGGWKPAPPALPDHSFWQSCYGIPGATDPSNYQCRVCPLLAGCQEFAASVELKVLQSTGHSDPVREHRRRVGRERKARWDANKKLALAEVQSRPE